MSVDVMREDNYPSDAAPLKTQHLDGDNLGSKDFNTMPYLTQQYALPIHHGSPSSIERIGQALQDDGERTPRPENTLRRKTPNGTLNSGFQASTDVSNPQKHQILAPSESNALRYASPVVPAVKQTFLQHQRQRAQNGSPAVWNGTSAMGWSGAPFTMSPSPLTLDSVLHQMPTHPYTMQQFYTQTVPSVLQPSIQNLGPTASGVQGSGPYGPYWHDGTFVPYRPAAVRDPRFYHHHNHHQAAHWAGSLGGPQLMPNVSLWQQNAVPQPGWNPSQNLSLWMNQPLPTSQTSLSPHPLSHHGQPVALQRNHQPHSKPPVLNNPHGQAQHAASSRFENAEDVMRSQKGVKMDYGSSSDNGRQRDKIFSWALQQYRDLLTFIHTTRRQQQQVRQAQGQTQVAHRPSIYPRPPKPIQSGPTPLRDRRLPDGDSLAQADNSKRPELPQRADTAPAGANSSRNKDSELEVPKQRPPPGWSPGAVRFHDNEYHRRASHDQFRRSQQMPYPQANGIVNQQMSRRASGTPTASFLPSLPADDSPPSRAQVALQAVTKMCQDADWQWVDGMHLGGCLAYGLGLYPKALTFYTKVLEIEPKHLEAISNLAAAFLALGRRTEAEQHWFKVVKAAPNHFEAVEHLIGMLCTEQRSRDAVKVIEHVERSLRQSKGAESPKSADPKSCASSAASKSPPASEASEKIIYDFDDDGESVSVDCRDAPGASEPGFGSSGFAIPGSENGRILALIHAKGNMLYGLGDNAGAAKAFEDAVLIAVGREFNDIRSLVKHILAVVTAGIRNGQALQHGQHPSPGPPSASDPILLTPEQALNTARLCFPLLGELPGLQYLPGSIQTLARKAVISTTSNSLLSLAKIFQDTMSNSSRSAGITPLSSGVRDILGLYYLSFSLQQSPSTANNVGILLASVQQKTSATALPQRTEIPGVVPGSGVALALQYYNYGLGLDQHHAHLYTNLGSLLKDIGQLDAAISMYERAVKCDPKFDIALANLANAVKDKGRINDAISYYKRAVDASPDFAEAVCGLANALNSVCSWGSRGGIADEGGKRDRWHVDPQGMLVDARHPGVRNSGWIKRVIEIVEKQLVDGESWGAGVLSSAMINQLLERFDWQHDSPLQGKKHPKAIRTTLLQWMGQKWEGARVVRLVERATKRLTWQWYRDLYVDKKTRDAASYDRPHLPMTLTTPSAPTVLPFHTFTCPMSAKQIRMISQRNGLRISVSTLRAPWLPKQVFPPPKPPEPFLRVGYVSSDFNNHPLAHLMQSVFGMHDRNRVKAYCYATTASDKSSHRRQIEDEAPSFVDASGWSTEKLVNQIVQDGIHILVNLNGYTRGARNEVFAARPAPIQMSFMGFAGTLGAEWCDYLLADETAIPSNTLRPWRRNVDLEDQTVDENNGGENTDWVYGENIIYCRDTFFCCDHRQSAPDAIDQPRLTWDEERERRWAMRKELFPKISDDTIIFGNFNQLYKIEPTTFRTWLRILARVPNSILWLLRFPDTGQVHLQNTARLWAGAEVASRVHFTDVAPKHLHISRARICDLVLDTAECNAHTTAADVLWSGSPLLTLPRYNYKMCSRMAASILKGALPRSPAGEAAARDLIATDEADYEEKAVALGKGFVVNPPRSKKPGQGQGRLMELRRLLFESRWECALFDTRRWVADLEDGYDEAWRRWVAGEGGDIWLDRLPRGRVSNGGD